MNWYDNIKISQEVKSFKDRNRINERIRSFSDLVEKLNYLSNADSGQGYIYQNPGGAYKALDVILSGKQLSSFPQIHKRLMKAKEKVLDNPKEAQLQVSTAIYSLTSIIQKMKQARKDFGKKFWPKKVKEILNYEQSSS